MKFTIIPSMNQSHGVLRGQWPLIVCLGETGKFAVPLEESNLCMGPYKKVSIRDLHAASEDIAVSTALLAHAPLLDAVDAPGISSLHD